MSNANFPSQDKLKALPVHGFNGLLQFYSEQKWKAKETGTPEVPRVLVKDADFLELVDALLEIKLGLRELKTYSPPRLKLLPPPAHRNGDKADYYVYPDHFEALAAVLTLRKVHHLPLKAIQQLMEHLPEEHRQMIISRMLSTGELLDLAKMGSQGFALKDLVMAKACQVMLQDVLPSSQALLVATQTGDALEKLEEKLIMARLEEIRAWVSSGRMRQFVRREAAQDFKDLAHKHLMGKKISRKMLARKARLAREK